MNIRKDIDIVMESVQVDENMKTTILNAAIQTRKNERGRVMKKKMLMLALAAVMCLGTIAVAASTVPKLWGTIILDYFKVDDELQDKLVDEGYVEDISSDMAETQSDLKNDSDGKIEVEYGMSVSEDGVTVTLMQAMVSPTALNLFFEVESEDGVKINEADFFRASLLINGETAESSSSSTTIEATTTDGTKGTYALSISLDDMDKKVIGENLTIILGELYLMTPETALSGGIIAEGEWKFDFKVEGSYKSKKIDLDYAYTTETRLGDAVYNLESIEIFPMEIIINYHTDDTKCHMLPEANNIPIRIVMKNGKEYADLDPSNDYIEGDNFVCAGFESTIGEYEKRKLYEIIDIDEIDYIEVGGVRHDLN